MSTAETRGLAVIAPQQALTAGLSEAEWERRKDMFRRLIVKDGDPARVDLAMVICRQYGFDPILKHVVLIDGSVYVTRDGLLHIAHASGAFNGIEVTMTQLAGGEWAATATVYRKDMSRPIRYTVFEYEHKPTNPHQKSAWAKYPRAMLAKCAEVAALRRAFDVSLGAVEELGYDGVEPSSSIGAVTVITEVVDGDRQGRPGPAAAQLPAPARVAQAGVADAGQAEAGAIPEVLGWDAFWRWAKARDLKDRRALDAAVGADTGEMTPAAIKRAILSRAPGGQKRPMTADETLEWLGVEGREVARYASGCKHLFGLSEDQAELEAYRATAIDLGVPGEAVAGAWHDRMVDLGRPIDSMPAVEEELPPIEMAGTVASEQDVIALLADDPGW